MRSQELSLFTISSVNTSDLFKRFLICFTICVISGCTQAFDQKKTVPDQSIFTQTACQFPCWQGLVIGESELDETLDAIRNIEFVDQSTLNQENLDHRTIIWWWQTAPQQASRLIFQDGVLRSAEIIPLIEFRLQDVLEIFGEPSAVSSRFERNQYGERLANVYLFYPQIGAIFRFQTSEANHQHLIDATVEGIDFYLYRPKEDISAFIDDFMVETGFRIEFQVTAWADIDLPFVVIPDAENYLAPPLLYLYRLMQWNKAEMQPHPPTPSPFHSAEASAI
jgi:hypothetical protein